MELGGHIFFGFEVTGTGPDTVVRVWTDPVGKRPSDWGPAAWTSSVDPGAARYADTGQHVGLYVKFPAPEARGSFDDFTAGSE